MTSMSGPPGSRATGGLDQVALALAIGLLGIGLLALTGVISFHLLFLAAAPFFLVVAYCSWRADGDRLNVGILLGWAAADFCIGLGGLTGLTLLSLAGTLLVFSTMLAFVPWAIQRRKKQ